LYELIWRRFIASQMAPCKIEQSIVEISNQPGSAQHRYLFRNTSTRIVFPGYRQVYHLKDASEDSDEVEESQSLPPLKKDDPVNLRKIDTQQKFTEPPPQFSEAMLVRELEKNGVGRPSTYAAIIDTIKKRDYVVKQRGKLVPTELGKRVNRFLCEHLDPLFNVKFTAKMEESLDDIERGKLDWVQMLREFYNQFIRWMEAARCRNAPQHDDTQALLELFHHDIPLSDTGKGAYNDRKFFESVKKQIEKGKRLSERQWNAFLRLMAKYQQHIPNLRATLERIGHLEDFEKISAQLDIEAAYQPDPAVMEIVHMLEQVKEWEPSENRRRDDKRFFNSLKTQLERKPLTEKQLNVLKRLALKYADQIPDHESKFQANPILATALESTSAASDQQGDSHNLVYEECKALLELADHIREWADPVVRRGRSYDDKSFIESLRSQFKQKRTLSDRQKAALIKTLTKYADQIPNFKETCERFGITVQVGNEKTGVSCPECKEGELLRRHSRRGNREFFGCSRYPKCKYLTNTLPDASK
ncbi:MAG: hypothetical protein D6820_18465, partial [Lentisphaerae bacterium]